MVMLRSAGRFKNALVDRAPRPSTIFSTLALRSHSCRWTAVFRRRRYLPANTGRRGVGVLSEMDGIKS
jgi:hypothetical protein